MLSVLYLAYIIIAFTFFLFYGKVPKYLQLAIIVLLSTLFITHNSYISIYKTIQYYQQGKATLSDVLVAVGYSYLNSWSIYDNSLYTYATSSKYPPEKKMAGVLIFTSLDLTFLLLLTYLIFWISNTFRIAIFRRKGISDEENKKEELFLIILSLVISFYIGYMSFGMKGLILIMNYVYKKVAAIIGLQ